MGEPFNFDDAIKDMPEFAEFVNGSVGGDNRPEIQIMSGDLPHMVDEAEQALLALPGPMVFQRARMLCRILPAETSPKWMNRPPGSPEITRIDVVALYEIACHAAQWLKFDVKSKQWKIVDAHTKTIATLIARQQWKFPTLESIITAPTLRPDGVVIDKPGFDKETGLYFDANGTVFPPVPENPSREDAQVAFSTLFQPFVDFPFKRECHQIALVAAIMTLVCRFTIQGNVPVFSVRSTTRGSGKGLLVNAIAMIATGRVAPTWTQAGDPSEEGKRLLSVAIAGDACMHIDNVAHPFGSEKLDSIVTSRTIKDRLLGQNEDCEAPWNTVIFTSGNNMLFLGDMARRVMPIDLDPKSEHPEERNDFVHSPLLEWIHAQRPQLVVAALTILKAYFVAGCPSQGVTLGSFEEWSGFIRQSLLWAGYVDPCQGRVNIQAESEAGYEALTAVLTAWETCYGLEAVTLRHALQDIERKKIADPGPAVPGNEWNELFDALASLDDRFRGKINMSKTGQMLKKMEGQVRETRRLIRDGEDHNAAKWKIEIVETL